MSEYIIREDRANISLPIETLLVYPSYNMRTPSYFMTVEQKFPARGVNVYNADVEVDNISIRIKNIIARVKGNIGLHFIAVNDLELPLDSTSLLLSGTIYFTIEVIYSTDESDLATIVKYRFEDISGELRGTPIFKVDYISGVFRNLDYLEEDYREDCRCGDIISKTDNFTASPFITYKTKGDLIVSLPTIHKDCIESDMSWVKILASDEVEVIPADETVKVNCFDKISVLNRCTMTEFYYDCESNAWVSSRELLKRIRFEDDLPIKIIELSSSFQSDSPITTHEFTPLLKALNVLVVGQSNIAGHVESNQYAFKRDVNIMGLDGEWHKEEAEFTFRLTPETLWVEATPIVEYSEDCPCEPDEPIVFHDKYRSYVGELFDSFLSSNLDYKRVNLINIAMGGSSVKDWAYGGKREVRSDDAFIYKRDELFERVVWAIERFENYSLVVDYVLYHQGETDAQNLLKEIKEISITGDCIEVSAVTCKIDELKARAKANYKRNFLNFRDSLYNRLGYKIPIYLCIATYALGEISETIQQAQRELIEEEELILMGINTDNFIVGCRQTDNTHLNQNGVTKAIGAWLEVLNG